MIIKHDPRQQLIHQLNCIYPGGVSENETEIINRTVPVTLKKLEFCFSHVANKYYHIMGGETIFDPLHVAQWTMFLYTIANKIMGEGYIDLCDKIYGISKCFSSADIFYGIEMPDIWFFDHPQGSVMGRAQYRNFFTFCQGCTVGNNKGIYPVFGEHVSMFSNSKILGNCRIGDHVILAANSYVIDTDIPSYSIVFGNSPHLVVKPITSEEFKELTNSMLIYTE